MPSKNKYINALVYIFVLFSLTKCSNLHILSNSATPIPKAQQAEVWQRNKQILLNFKQQNNWTLLARVGIVSQQGSSSNQLDWINQNNNYKITLNNMLTYGVITIASNNSQDGRQVNLNYQDQTYTAKTPEDLLFQLTKLKLPISQLEYWILGLPAPNYQINKLNLNEFALINNLQQNGFNIEYEDYNYSISRNAMLPGKIIIKTKGLYIKIIAQSWFK